MVAGVSVPSQRRAAGALDRERARSLGVGERQRVEVGQRGLGTDVAFTTARSTRVCAIYAIVAACCSVTVSRTPRRVVADDLDALLASALRVTAGG